MVDLVTEPLIDVESISFAYGRDEILTGVTFQVHAGQFVALVGANGSGKSTLLRVLLGLLEPRAGNVRLLGQPPQRLAERWRLGYVPQRPPSVELLPATVAEVVATGRLVRRGWWRRPDGSDRTAVLDAMAAVAVSDLAQRQLSELSGGQQQRVLIAKALVTGPDLLILDEPVTGVDAESQRRFRDALVQLAQQRGTAVLLVSHDLGAVADDLDRLLVLKHGKIVFDGAPEELTATGVNLGVHDHDLPLWLEGLG